jgi:hypothetical protein
VITNINTLRSNLKRLRIDLTALQICKKKEPPHITSMQGRKKVVSNKKIKRKDMTLLLYHKEKRRGKKNTPSKSYASFWPVTRPLPM